MKSSFLSEAAGGYLVSAEKKSTRLLRFDLSRLLIQEW